MSKNTGTGIAQKNNLGREINIRKDVQSPQQISNHRNVI